MLAGKRASLSAHGSDPYREVCAAHPPCPSRLLAPGSSRTDWDRDTGGRTGRRAPQLRRHHSLSLEPLHCRPCHQKRAWPALTDMRQQRGCACPLPLALSVKAGQPQARGDRYALAYASTPGSGPSTTLVSRPTLTATLGIFERAAVFEHCCPLFPLMRLLSASRPRRLLATSWFPRTDFPDSPAVGRPGGRHGLADVWVVEVECGVLRPDAGDAVEIVSRGRAGRRPLQGPGKAPRVVFGDPGAGPPREVDIEDEEQDGQGQEPGANGGDDVQRGDVSGQKRA
jgi:hypothetical protein